MNIQLRKKQILNSSCQYTTKVITVQESRIIELSNYISNHDLTSCLEVLEQCGYSGELAIFVLANLQVGGAA
jgi:hypothetical protein